MGKTGQANIALFWRALEQVPGLSAVGLVWKRLLGPDYVVCQGLLQPTADRALSYPCPLEHDCGCYHEVIVHRGGDIVAACRCEPENCRTVQLEAAEVVVYEVDVPALCEAASSAIGTDGVATEIDTCHYTWQLGTHSPTAGYRFPVYLTIPLEALAPTVEHIAVSTEKPFILLAPTRELVSLRCDEILSRRNACLITLSELLYLQQDGSLIALEPPPQALTAFLSNVLPKATKEPVAFFETPPDSAWQDVSIRFKDGHTVSIKVKDASGVYNYTQMGMASSKNGEPTEQWKLLQTFAEENGTLVWGSGKGNRRYQKAHPGNGRMGHPCELERLSSMHPESRVSNG